MKLHIENSFPADPRTIWDLFISRDFESRLEEASGVIYETLSEEMVDGVECRRVKVTAKKDLPRIVAKALGSGRLSYTQVTYLDRDTHILEWEVIPMAMSDQVTAKGVTMIVPEEDGGCRRVVDGNVSVRIPLVGGAIEKAIVREVEDSYNKASTMALTMLDERAAS